MDYLTEVRVDGRDVVPMNQTGRADSQEATRIQGGGFDGRVAEVV